jgi:hypothetical protein
MRTENVEYKTAETCRVVRVSLILKEGYIEVSKDEFKKINPYGFLVRVTLTNSEVFLCEDKP